MSLIWDDQCERCLSRCVHGVCDCDAEPCTECWIQWNLQQDAKREAEFQKMMGVMCGFDREVQ